MFEDTGRPQGYGQHSPFTDTPKAPGAVPEEKSPTGMGSGTPATPLDPTLSAWRNPASNTRALGAPHGMPPPPPAQSSPLQSAIAGGAGSQATGGLGAPPPPAGNPNDPIAALYAKHGVQAGGDGSGFLDKAYWQKQADAKGGWFGAGGNDPYWNNRLDSDLSGTGPDGKPQAQTGQASPLMSAITNQAPPPVDPSMDQTGTANPLLAAIRQSLQARQQPQGMSYGR